MPAPYNLPVPPYTFANPTILTIGENAKNETFDLAAISQI